MTSPSSRCRTRFGLALVCALAIAPNPSAAWSFSSIFGGDDDSGSGSSTQATAEAPVTNKNADGSADLSDGTDIKVEQPLLKPTDWFLTEQEILDSRGGIPRDGLETYTTGNNVTTFTVTKDFFESVYDDFSATKEGDRVMYAGWDTALIPFEADVDPSGNKTRFDVVFKGIVERGGHVNLLNWANYLLSGHNIKARDAINAIPPSPINGAKAVYLFDDRLPNSLSSHHQKTITIAVNKSTGEDEHPIAYVGGLDLTNDRWDTMYHNVTAIRDAADITFRNKGWMDASFRIHGPAAKDVANNFLARWNSDYIPCKGLDDDLMDFANPDYDKLPPIDYASSTTSSSLGNKNVQIVRTFSCKYKYYKEFAPHGEQSLFQSRIKALRNAKNYIYVEDQYFVLVPELMDVLMEVLPNIQRLIAVVQPPFTSVKLSGYEKYLYEMIEPLKKKFPNKVQIYTTKTDRKIYIHTKLVLIDDVYASAGRVSGRYHGTKAMRIRKFEEMTGLSYEEVDAMKFIDAADQLKIAAADESSIIQNLEVGYHLYYMGFPDLVRQQADPQETCSFSSSSGSS
ncbi:hypothetical protein BBO99_00000242 [Phytophthora kernoviae]|uniref:Phospholipase D n=1 Tax=Phytophthora kernoviae TaxID=325452 RepID=A0A3R7NMT6_9STRA|nr:hypothetical protein BBI17_000348 [Phytophthora kernoviae]RLN85709.1 hypothetical protein BBO99_00000242 [Phytophthora kernoviae]